MEIESKCKFCGTPLEAEDSFIIFCGVKCQLYYALGVEKKMSKIEKISLPEALFKSWLEDETNRVDKLTSAEIQERIIELEKIIFESKTRLSIAHQKKIKLQGSDWANDFNANSDLSFKVDYEKDQRKRESSVPKQSKEEKAQTLQAAAGIDPKKLKEIIKQKMLERAKKPMVLPTKPVEPIKKEGE